MNILARGAVALLLLITAACETTQYTGRSQIMLLGEGQEQEMGLTAYQEVLSKAKVSGNAVVNDQVVRVGRRIAQATGKNYEWEFKVLEDKQANAFCLPGGKIAVYTGILPITRDDPGLAAVLGHEVAHAVLRHGGERVSQNLLAQMTVGAAQVALANRDPATVQAVTSLLGAGITVGALLPWSRSQESEADHVGLILMAKAGYHPSAARELWVRMLEASKGSQKPPEFLSTHPAEQTRISQIEAWTPEVVAQYYRPR